MVWCCELCGSVVKKGEYNNVRGKITHKDACSMYYHMKKISSIKTKGEAQDEAVEWQMWMSQQNLSYGELSEYQTYFKKLAIKFKLQEEFEENGIL